MISKKRQLKGSLLCVILDSDSLNEKRLLRVASSAVRGGADMLQLRGKSSSSGSMLKTALRLKASLRDSGVPLVINDRLDVAVAADADGIHLGQGDMSVSVARRLMGRDKLIGVSVKEIRQAVTAKREGASYVGVGPVFATPVKAEEKARGIRFLEKVKKIGMPLIAIGGIEQKNIHKLAKKGFCRIAVIRAVCGARDPFAATKRLKKALS